MAREKLEEWLNKKEVKMKMMLNRGTDKQKVKKYERIVKEAFFKKSCDRICTDNKKAFFKYKDDHEMIEARYNVGLKTYNKGLEKERFSALDESNGWLEYMISLSLIEGKHYLQKENFENLFESPKKAVLDTRFWVKTMYGNLAADVYDHFFTGNGADFEIEMRRVFEDLKIKKLVYSKIKEKINDDFERKKNFRTSIQQTNYSDRELKGALGAINIHWKITSSDSIETWFEDKYDWDLHEGRSSFYSYILIEKFKLVGAKDFFLKSKPKPFIIPVSDVVNYNI